MGPTRADIFRGITQSRASLKAIGEGLSASVRTLTTVVTTHANSFERIEMGEHHLVATHGCVVRLLECRTYGAATGGVGRFNLYV